MKNIGLLAIQYVIYNIFSIPELAGGGGGEGIQKYIIRILILQLLHSRAGEDCITW